mgnify:CR=1 FL=1
MIDLQNRDYQPTLNEMGEYVRNPVFREFCGEIMGTYRCAEKIEYSSCSMERGWNVKFKKSGKSLCTIYLREQYFTVLLVVSRKEKEAVETIMPECCAALRDIYDRTREGNGQRWLMVDLEDRDELYRDVLRGIAIRASK